MDKKDDKSDILKQAIRSVKGNINFFQDLLIKLKKGNEIEKLLALWTARCLHDYVGGQLMKDVKFNLDQIHKHIKKGEMN